VYIPGCLHTLLTILKSKSLVLLLEELVLILLFRVLLATIRDKGLCPCPRCLVPKLKLDCLGLRQDVIVRVTQLRTYLAGKVSSARKAIYNLAKPINGAAVEDLLKAFLGVPTEVSYSICFHEEEYLFIHFRMPSCSASALSSIHPIC